MTERDFFILFGVAWATAMTYSGSMVLVGLRVRSLRANGRLPADVPSMLEGPGEMLRALKWMLMGRYGEVRDGTVRTLGTLARLAFAPALVLIGAVFWIGLTDLPEGLERRPVEVAAGSGQPPT